jgi:hypothetical protein
MVFSLVILTLFLALFSGLFYHMSGLGGNGQVLYPWAPKWVFARWWRRIGCMILDTVTILLWWHPVTLLGWLLVLLSMGLTYGAITTYWDTLFGFDNFWFHGFMIGLSRFPLIFVGKPWWAVLIRSIVLALLMGWVSAASGKDWKEEIGRGASMPLTGWI